MALPACCLANKVSEKVDDFTENVLKSCEHTLEHGVSSLFHEEATFDCCLALKAEASGVRPVVVVTVRRPRTEADLHFLLGAERTMALYMLTKL